VALLEVVLLADEFGYSVVATTLVVTAIEAVSDKTSFDGAETITCSID